VAVGRYLKRDQNMVDPVFMRVVFDLNMRRGSDDPAEILPTPPNFTDEIGIV